MPKTGGTWLRHYLLDNGKKHRFGHNTAARIEATEPKRYRYYGTIRDPWSWYSSWFFHCKRVKGHHAYMKQYYGGDSFSTVLPNLMEKTCKKEMFPLLTAYEEPDKWLAFEGGLYSYWFKEFYGDLVVKCIDTAQLYEGVEELFEVPVDRVKYPPINTGKHWGDVYKEPQEIYTPELVELVWKYDGPLAEKLGFKPFSMSSKGPVIRLD